MLGHDVEAVDGLPVERADRIKPLILPSPVLGEVAKRHPHLMPRAVPSGHLLIYRIAHAPRVVVRVFRIRIDQADVKRRPRSIPPHPELDRIARRGQRGQILEGLKIEANEPVERHPSPAHAVAAHRWVCLVIVIDRAFAEVVGLDHVRAEEVFVEHKILLVWLGHKIPLRRHVQPQRLQQRHIQIKIEQLVRPALKQAKTTSVVPSGPRDAPLLHVLPHHLVPQDAVAVVAVGAVHPKLPAKQRHAAILLKGRGLVEQYVYLRDGALLAVIAQRRADPRALQGRGQRRHARPLVGKGHAAQRHQRRIGPASALVGKDERLVEVKRVHEVVVGKNRHPLQVAEAVPVGRANDDRVLLIHLPNRVDHLLLDRVPSRVANAVWLVEYLVVELGRMRGKVRGELGPHRHQHVANIR